MTEDYRARSITVSNNTFAPFAQSCQDVSSLGEWLIPPMLGTKIIPIGDQSCHHLLRIVTSPTRQNADASPSRPADASIERCALARRQSGLPYARRESSRSQSVSPTQWRPHTPLFFRPAVRALAEERSPQFDRHANFAGNHVRGIRRNLQVAHSSHLSPRFAHDHLAEPAKVNSTAAIRAGPVSPASESLRGWPLLSIPQHCNHRWRRSRPTTPAHGALPSCASVPPCSI